MATPHTTYNTLQPNETNPFSQIQVENGEEDEENSDMEETPDNSGVMIHEVIPDTHKTRWNHIEDLDSFFSRMYSYHQKHGFKVMMLQEILELARFVFMITFLIYITHCINYPVLFREPGTINQNSTVKLTIKDVTLTSAQCVDSFGGYTWTLIVISSFFWVFRFIKMVCHFNQYLDIKSFFNVALKIDDSELDNLTWHEVQQRIRDVQSEQQMCVHKENLTELDIYHRILRFKNYQVAMMNKFLLPAKIKLPLLGEFVCLSKGLLYNIEFILFFGPFSPFENNWHLKEEFKRSNRRSELAKNLSRHIMWVALANTILSPIVFLWQLMYFFFNYAVIIKKEPNILGIRCWSQYGKLHLRHFNELDHELDARLNRAYRPAVKYMESFSSPLLAVIAHYIIFVFGGIAAFLVILTVYDEDVLLVEHVLTIMTLLTVVALTARSFIPDENLIWCPEQLLRNVLAHAHYLPVNWRGFAHTSNVRNQFEEFFQLKAMYILNEIFSPFITPFVLMFSLRHRSQEIVDFFRNFTVSVIGVGDVCSFAQMDVRKHGNMDWQLTNSSETSDISPTIETNQYTQGENGKTELSLVHFTLTNPNWKMPQDAKQFVRGIRKHAIQDLSKARNLGGFTNTTAMGQSLMGVDSLGEEYSSIVQSILQTHNLSTSQHLSMYQQPNYSYTQPSSQAAPSIISPSTNTFDFERLLQQNLTDGSTTTPLRSTFLPNIDEDEDSGAEHLIDTNHMSSMNMSLRGSLSRREGPMEGSRHGLLYSLCNIPASEQVFTPEFTTADMCLSTLYLHELHHKQIKRRGRRIEQSQRHLWQNPHHHSAQPSTSTQERTPLLAKKT